MAPVERSDEEFLIFELKLNDILLEEALIAFHNFDTGDFHVPLSDFVNAFEMPIIVNHEAGTAQGWISGQHDSFALSLPQGTVQIRDRTIDLEEGFVENHEDGIYVSLKALEDWFPLAFHVDFSNLVMRVSTLQTLPVESRLERDRRRDSIGGKNFNATRYNRLEKPEAPNFTLPFIDTSFQSNYTNDKTASKSFNTQYSATARNIIFGQDALYTINDQINDDQTPDIRMTLGRKAFRGDTLFAGLSEYALGDISTYTMPLIANSNAGRGLFFTNISQFKDSLGGSDTTTLRGPLPLGYQVDIKRGGELIDFVEAPDENGEYVFRDLFVLQGLNVFELVFYGPQGQVIVEEKRIFVSDEPIKKGEFEYRIHAIEDSTNLFTNRESNDEDISKLRVTAEASYGLNDRTSIRAGMATYSMDGERKDYGLLGLGTSLGGLWLDINQAFDDEGTASSLRLESVFQGIRWQAQHQYYDNFISERNNNSSLTGDLEHDTDLRISGMLPVLFLKNMPLTLQANRQENTQGDEQYEWSLRATKNINRLRLSTELEQTIPPVRDTETDLNFQISSRFDDFSIRGIARYEIEPDSGLDSIDLTSDIKLYDRTKLRAGFSRSGREDPSHTVTLGINQDIGVAQIGLDASYDDEGNATVLFGASFGFAYNQAHKKPYFSSKNLSNSSAVIAKTYQDLDANQEQNGADPDIEDVSLILPGNPKRFVTDENGLAFIPGIRSYDRSTVEILSQTFPNPFMKTDPVKVDYMMRPSQVHIQQYPIVLTGEVDGNIFIFEGGELVPAASIVFDVIREDGSVVVSGQSEYDGFLLIQDVPIGTYSVRPNATQLEELGYCPTKAMPIALSEEEPFYTVPQDFMIYPDPEIIDENRWLVLAKGLSREEALAYRDTAYAFDKAEDMQVLDDDPRPRIMPRFLYARNDNTDLYDVLSGPYQDLAAIRSCPYLQEKGYSCIDNIQLNCQSIKALDMSPVLHEYQ